jgi:hypothetical protein
MKTMLKVKVGEHELLLPINREDYRGMTAEQIYEELSGGEVCVVPEVSEGLYSRGCYCHGQ